MLTYRAKHAIMITKLKAHTSRYMREIYNVYLDEVVDHKHMAKC